MFKNFFGTDGIRGRVGEFPIENFFTVKLGISIAILLKRKSILGALVIGIDTRISSNSFAKLLTLGANIAGLNVYFCGIVPSAAIAIIVKNRDDIIVGCMISASHNQFHDNGFKFFDHNGVKFSKNIEYELTEIINNIEDDLSIYNSFISGLYYDIDLISIYYNFINLLLNKSIKRTNLKIVCDCANGSLSFCANNLLFNKILDFIYIGNNPNGYNINLKSGSEFSSFLSNNVVKCYADLGFACDGDGDRLVVCDEFGEIVDFNHIMALLILFNKEKNNDFSGFVSNNMVNDALILFAKKHNIPFFLSDVGDSNISHLMREKKCKLGGESSGHFIFNMFCIVSDSLITMIKIIEALQFFNLQMSEIRKFFVLNPQKIYNYYYNDRTVIENIINSDIFKNFISNMLDVKIFIRFSGTEKCLRITISAINVNIVDNVLKNIVHFISKSFSKENNV